MSSKRFKVDVSRYLDIEAADQISDTSTESATDDGMAFRVP